MGKNNKSGNDSSPNSLSLAGKFKDVNLNLNNNPKDALIDIIVEQRTELDRLRANMGTYERLVKQLTNEVKVLKEINQKLFWGNS